MRVVVADDALLTRQGVVHVLADAGLEVVAEVGDPESLLEAVERHRPDVGERGVLLTDPGLSKTVSTGRVRSDDRQGVFRIRRRSARPASH